MNLDCCVAGCSESVQTILLGLALCEYHLIASWEMKADWSDMTAGALYQALSDLASVVVDEDSHDDIDWFASVHEFAAARGWG